jgi:von Willebrand factor type A domain.
MIANTIGYVLKAVVPAAILISLVIAGLILMVKKDDPEILEKIKNTFKAVAIGAFVAYSGWLIVTLALTVTGSFNKDSWWKFQLSCQSCGDGIVQSSEECEPAENIDECVARGGGDETECENLIASCDDNCKIGITPPVVETPLSVNCTNSIDSCGLNTVLVMDSSLSISNSSLVLMKNAFKNFTNTLSGTPSQFSVIDFDTNATLLNGFTSDINAINAAIGTPRSDGVTNWEAALVAAKDAFASSNSNRKNLIIFASDGNPTRCIGTLAANNRRMARDCNKNEALAAALTQAATIKSSGIRIIGIGLGNSLKANNMIAVSSPESYYSVSDYGQLAATLEEIATELCGGTISVNKVIDRDGNLATTDDQINSNSQELAAWAYTIAGEANKITDSNGRADSVCVDTAEGPFSIAEQQSASKAGYHLVSGSCTGSSQSNGAFSADRQEISGIYVGNNDIVSCIFYSAP